MRFNNSKIESVRKLLIGLGRSALKITQVFDAIRTWVLQRLDYCFMNSVVSLTKIRKVNNLIREIINEKIGTPFLKDMFYTSWKNGGLGIKTLRERYFACKFNNLAHFFLRDDETEPLSFGS
jgi:hypothetical protein